MASPFKRLFNTDEQSQKATSGSSSDANLLQIPRESLESALGLPAGSGGNTTFIDVPKEVFQSGTEPGALVTTIGQLGLYFPPVLTIGGGNADPATPIEILMDPASLQAEPAQPQALSLPSNGTNGLSDRAFPQPGLPVSSPFSQGDRPFPGSSNEAFLPPPPTAQQTPSQGTPNQLGNSAPSPFSPVNSSQNGLPPKTPERATPLETATPAAPPATPPNSLEVPLVALLEGVSDNDLGFAKATVPTETMVGLPLDQVRAQIPNGQVDFPAAQVASLCASPAREILSASPQDLRLVLPMREIFHRLPKTELTPPPATSAAETVASEFSSPFTKLANAASDEQEKPTSEPAEPVAVSNPSEPEVAPTPKDLPRPSQPAPESVPSVAETAPVAKSSPAEKEADLLDVGAARLEEATGTLSEEMLADSKEPASSAIDGGMEGLSGSELLNILERFTIEHEQTTQNGINAIAAPDTEAPPVIEQSAPIITPPKTEAPAPPEEKAPPIEPFQPQASEEKPQKENKVEKTEKAPSEKPASEKEDKKPLVAEKPIAPPTSTKPPKVKPERPSPPKEDKTNSIEPSNTQGMSAGLHSEEVPEQLELKAIFGINRQLSGRDIVDLCSELPGVQACVAILPDGPLRPTVESTGKGASRFYGRAPVLLDHVTELAADLGIEDLSILNVRTKDAMKTFIRQGDVHLAVMHEGEDGFAGGVREKLIIATRELDRETRAQRNDQ